MTTLVKNRFDAGILNDPRTPSSAAGMMITNFDVTTDPFRMIPFRNSESGDSAATTSQKQNFCIALGPSSTYYLFALGVVSGSAKAEILRKALSTGGTSDLSDAGWGTPANNASASGTTSFNLFVYYKKTGLIYGAKAGTTIWAFDPAGSVAFDDASHSLSYTNICQGIVHSKDNRLYIGYDNKIAVNNNGSWNDTGLVLPDHYYITSICEDGNYLAVACAPISGVGNSRVFLWDRDTSLSTVSESIDWGAGVLTILDEVDGVLTGISVISGVSSTRGRVIFKYLSGIRAERYLELVATSNGAVSLPIAKQKVNNRLYFMMSGVFNGATREGVWSFGRVTPGSPMMLVHERTPNNDTALVSGVLKGFFVVYEFMFISYITGASPAYALSKTNDQNLYTATAIFESLVNPNQSADDREADKQLTGVAISHSPLTTGQSVKLYYRVDSDPTGVWNLAISSGTVGAVGFETARLADGTEFSHGQNMEFRVESTGGAEVYSFQYMYTPLMTLV